jgi:tetratricopeptide (TPR) repeat protein
LDPLLIGRAESLRAHVAVNEGNLVEAIAGYRRAASHNESIGHRRAACEALGNLSISLLELGQLEEAEACMRQLLATAQKLALNFIVGGGLANLTAILAYRGSLDEARATGKHAVAVTIAKNDRRFQGYAEAYLSVTEYLAGDYARAEQYARVAMTTWDTVLSARPFACALLARALLAQGRQAEALLSAQDAHSRLESAGVVDDGEATIRLALAECLIAAGDMLAAQAILKNASRRILVSAEAIDDPASRESFLTRIPERRHILELSRELAAPKS